MRFSRLILATLLFVLLLVLGSYPVVGYLSLGGALDPVRGLYSSARAARPIDGVRHLGGDSTVTVEFDERGVPHIFAATNLDATRALGYVSARDRLFQMDFLPRVASGRLAEILGEEAVETDRFLRATGMRDGAERNWARIYREAGVEFHLLEAFAAGANAYIESLTTRELPIEYRLLGFEPDPFTPMKSLLVAQLMNYDLTYEQPDPAFINVVSRYGRAAYDSLYPTSLPYSVPMVAGSRESQPRRSAQAELKRESADLAGVDGFDIVDLRPGYFPGIGSNNWVVEGAATRSGSPLLAGDMHLNLTLPSIWYEAHLNAPGLNVYGVTIPGSPVIIAGFTDSLAWSFTNSAADQVDHYLLQTDSTSRHYELDGAWVPFDMTIDTIRVRGAEPVIDTLRTSRFGPVLSYADQSIAVQWVGHKENRIVAALFSMNRARNAAEFEEALKSWDSPMQNIAFADSDGETAIRTTGFLPTRRRGDGCGLLDGTIRDGVWVGRVPFDRMPVVSNPAAYASSTNQRPVEADYYINCTWTSAFRSVRINELLSAADSMTADDMARFQSDVRSVAAQLFVPLLDDLLDDLLSDAALSAAADLAAWDGEMATGRREPVLFARWIANLEDFVWDEAAFDEGELPHRSVLHRLIVDDPNSRWFDRPGTDGVETATDAIVAAFEEALGDVDEGATWGEAHRLTIRHVTRLQQLRPFWRGPFAFPGYDETLSPGREMDVVSGASWRMIVDLSTTPPAARGIYPGGQSGDPLSARYETSLADYLRFAYYDLRLTSRPGELGGRILRFRAPQNGSSLGMPGR